MHSVGSIVTQEMDKTTTHKHFYPLIVLKQLYKHFSPQTLEYTCGYMHTLYMTRTDTSFRNDACNACWKNAMTARTSVQHKQRS